MRKAIIFTSAMVVSLYFSISQVAYGQCVNTINVGQGGIGVAQKDGGYSLLTFTTGKEPKLTEYQVMIPPHQPECRFVI